MGEFLVYVHASFRLGVRECHNNSRSPALAREQGVKHCHCLLSQTSVRELENVVTICAHLPQWGSKGVTATTCTLQAQQSSAVVLSPLSPTCPGRWQEDVKFKLTHVCCRLSGECKDGLRQCLHLQGECQLPPASTACAFTCYLLLHFCSRCFQISKGISHIVQVLPKLLSFFSHWGLEANETLFQTFKREPQFPIAFWIPWTSAPLVFRTRYFRGSSRWCRPRGLE